MVERPSELNRTALKWEGFAIGLVLGIFGVVGAFMFSDEAKRGDRTLGALMALVAWVGLLLVLAGLSGS